MSPVILSALCLWSCVLTVTTLDQEQLGRVTNYFEQNIFKGYDKQYAYFVKFTADECNRGLQNSDLQNVMKAINANDLLSKVKNRDVIYEGKRMVAAAPKDRIIPSGKTITEHSEFRLLNPDNNSPISRLLGSDFPAGCVIFFSLNSPCVKTCTSPKGPFNIVTKIKNTSRLPNNLKDRAFVFRKVFHYDKKEKKETVWSSWSDLNTVTPLFSFNKNNCIKCFFNNRRDDKCYDD